VTVRLDNMVLASPDHVACDLEAETVILSLKTGEYFGLNAVAAAVWKLIQERRDVVGLRDALLETFTNVTKAQCEVELVNLLSQMAELKLIEVT